MDLDEGCGVGDSRKGACAPGPAASSLAVHPIFQRGPGSNSCAALYRPWFPPQSQGNSPRPHTAPKHVTRRNRAAHRRGHRHVEIVQPTGKSKTCVRRWQERFAEQCVGGLLRDKTRPSRIARLEPDVIERVMVLTLTDAPCETTHWSATMMTDASKITSKLNLRWMFHCFLSRRMTCVL